jgi:hypothetical protein
VRNSISEVSYESDTADNPSRAQRLRIVAQNSVDDDESVKTAATETAGGDHDVFLERAFFIFHQVDP